MSPASTKRTRQLFSAAAAVVLGLQFAPWPTTIQAQGNAPAPLVVQTQIKPISHSRREKRRAGNSEAEVTPTQPPEEPEDLPTSTSQQPPRQIPRQQMPLQQQQYSQPQMQMQQRPGPPQVQKSAVQLELEKLYRKEGRPVPEMVNPNFTPSTNNQSAQPAPRTYQQPDQPLTQQYAPQVQQYQQPVQQFAPQVQQYQQPGQQYAPQAQQYQQPAQQYAQPGQQYAPPGQPAQMYQQPVQQYAQPAPQYAPPAQQYQQPVQQYAPPVQQPVQQYSQPAQSVSAPKKKGILSKWFTLGSEDGPTQPPTEPAYYPPVATPPAALPAAVNNQQVAPPAAQPATGLPNYGQLFAPGNGVADSQPLAAPAQVPVQQPVTGLQPLNVVPVPIQQAPAMIIQPQSQPSSAVSNPAVDGFEAPLFVETPPAAGADGTPENDAQVPLNNAATDTVQLGEAAPLPVAAEPPKAVDPFSEDALFPGSAAPAAALTTAAESPVLAPAAEAETTVATEAAPTEPAPPVVEEAPVDENPYSGLTLDADPFSNPAALQAATVAPREIPVDTGNASQETVEGTPPVLMPLPSSNTVEAEDAPLVVDDAEVSPRPRPVPRVGSERTRAKQELIAARKGLRGLKGFCPVVLREDRDLVDAHSQFRAVYNSKTYYLSTSQAVAAFHSDPAKYAPAARGCDVIHLAITGEELEGTLDFAVWYKGRLYLFSSAETMDTFVSAPSSHATLE